MYPSSDDPLPPGRSRETEIRRDRAGRWYDGEDPIVHPKIRRCFERWLERDVAGRYRLRNAIHWVYVHVEGPALRVRALARDAAQRHTMRLSNDTVAELDPDTLCVDGEGRLICRIAEQNMEAVFEAAALVQLQDDLHEDENGIYFRGTDERRHYVQSQSSTE